MDLPPTAPKLRLPGQRDRKTTSERGYGHDHQEQRKRLKAKHPLCQRCGSAWSVHLHHRDKNPHNRADTNCEMLCVKCHLEEHGSSRQ